MRQKEVEILGREKVRIPHSKADSFLPTFGNRNFSCMATSLQEEVLWVHRGSAMQGWATGWS